MQRDDYIKAVKDDVIEYIKNNNLTAADFQNLADCQKRLHDYLWVEDSVTGNGSGSYTFDSEKAKKNLEGAEEILKDMSFDFDCAQTAFERWLNREWEWFDVSIRCYLLVDAIDEAINELRWEWEE